LMIAAHPDDENTNLLAYFARGRYFRTGYLSLTRGEGGQNLIGAEQGDFMGLIRTQELLAARRVDGAEQFFTRAIDFGFSKTAEETLAKWGRDQTLGDMVWVIRKFRPDIILLRFSGSPRDGHGHHQSSAILAKEAFFAAADPKRFPEQLDYVRPWQARRVYYNVFAFTPEQEKENARLANRLEIDAGEYNPILGYSYGEIAGMSRSKHASQAMGSPERRGAIRNHLVLIAGEPAIKDPMEGIDTSWNRLPGGAAIAPLLADAARAFRPFEPRKTLPSLLKARTLAAAIRHPDAEYKLRELDETIALCAGIWVDASSDRFTAVPGSTARISLTAVQRIRMATTFLGAALEGPGAPQLDLEETPLPFNEPVQRRLEWNVPANASYTHPYWLEKPKNGERYTVEDTLLVGQPENPPVLSARFRFMINGIEFAVVRPVHHRYVDTVRGELTRPLVIVPPVAVEFSDTVILFPETKPRSVQVAVKANQPNAAGIVRLEALAGWRIEPAQRPFRLTEAGEQTTVQFILTPPAAESTAALAAIAEIGGRKESRSMRVISYPHIPAQTALPAASAQLIRAEIKTLARNAGYIMGAGDEIPEALRPLGIQVTLLRDEEIAAGDLSRFDAILTGVRAFNTRPALRANLQRLLDYVSAGGTLVVQYNVLDGFPGRETRNLLARLGPYPITIGRSRVSVEESPVHFPNPNHPVLQSPNRITAKDFEGWVQERGLYFASQFDSRYESLFSTRDPGEDWLPGGALYTRYGKGAYVFTAYSWFRQLPAGVPGAFRIFANLISAGKAGP
ncbi:MAG: PIG-L family deacetylase, partial [Acidobacteria bacterium]|nr:PIG-L family deacetylase [Acidobacteriota bacterium]